MSEVKKETQPSPKNGEAVVIPEIEIELSGGRKVKLSELVENLKTNKAVYMPHKEFTEMRQINSREQEGLEIVKKALTNNPSLEDVIMKAYNNQPIELGREVEVKKEIEDQEEDLDMDSKLVKALKEQVEKLTNKIESQGKQFDEYKVSQFKNDLDKVLSKDKYKYVKQAEVIQLLRDNKARNIVEAAELALKTTEDSLLKLAEERGYSKKEESKPVIEPKVEVPAADILGGGTAPENKPVAKEESSEDILDPDAWKTNLRKEAEKLFNK